MSALIIDIRPAQKLVHELRRINRLDARIDGIRAVVSEIRHGGTGWRIVNDVARFRQRIESSYHFPDGAA
jgi:hypothetical protein